MFRPFSSGLLNALQRFIIRVVEVAWELLLAICALFELDVCHSSRLLEKLVAVKDLVHFVFNLCFQIQLFHQLWYALGYVQSS